MPKHPPPFVSLVCEHFKDLPDPRIERTRLHSLLNVLVMALSCVVAGADGWDAMAAFAKLNRKWFEGFLDLPAGVPSADTFRRVLSSLEPKAFEKCFRELVTGLAQSLEGEVVAIDGKALRGAIQKAGSKTPLHLVHVWATKQRLLLSQRAVTRGASGEVAASLEMLALLDLRKAIVTTDANGCTAEMTTAIRAQGADYVLALKGNRGKQHEYVERLFADAEARRYVGVPKHVTRDDAHGRVEKRIVRVLEPTDWPTAKRAQWTDRRTAVQIERVRRVNGKTSTERHYYVSSLPPDPETHARVVREHWGIENHLHWSLDVTFGEDRRIIRDEVGAQNFALLARLALMLLRNEKSEKYGAPIKRKMAGWNPDYIFRVLTAGITKA
jgi:predicted transposase YbfD/YdcC